MKLFDYIAEKGCTEAEFLRELNKLLRRFGHSYSKHAYRKWKSGERMPGYIAARCITELTEGRVTPDDMQQAHLEFQKQHKLMKRSHVKLLLSGEPIAKDKASRGLALTSDEAKRLHDITAPLYKGGSHDGET